MVSESTESRLLHSSSGFSAPVSCGIIRLGWGAKMAEVTTALCAETPVRFAVSLTTRKEFYTGKHIKKSCPGHTQIPFIASQKSLRSRRTDVNLLRS